MTVSMFRSLRHRNYQLFFAGQLVSLIGTWMQNVAQSWLIYRLTHSALILGLAGFASQIPGFLLSPLGGALADRHNRHRIIVMTQTAAMLLAFALAALTLFNVVQVWHVLALSALLGAVNAFDIPARQSFVIEMVGKEDLSNAIALNSSMFNGARLVGPAIAGVLIAWIGEGWCFFMNAVSYIAVIAGLLWMILPRKERQHHTSSAMQHAAEGFRFVVASPPILTLLLLLGLVSLVGMPYVVLMPIFADQILKGGPQGLGILMALSGGGALLGALSLTLQRDIRGLGLWILLACLGFSASLIGFAESRSFWLSGCLLALAGFSMMVQMASSNTYIQAIVPDHLRGRVMAFYSMMFLGMTPFGSLMAGLLAKPLGAPNTVAIGGVVCLLGSLLFAGRLLGL